MRSFGWWEGGAGMLWAVSQAAPLRRVHVDNDLLLFQRARFPSPPKTQPDFTQHGS